MKRTRIIFGAYILLVVMTALIWIRVASAPPQETGPAEKLAQAVKPINGWYICADLGVGPVPGVPDPRARFRICHDDGWEVLGYCLQPNQPAPEIGTVCTRTESDTYLCGNGIQSLQEYGVVQTPAPTPTNTSTATATSTSTSTPTSTPTSTTTALPSPTNTTTPLAPSPTPATPTPTTSRRPAPGGMGFRDLLGLSKLLQFPRAFGATPTPFQPQTSTPTPFQPVLDPTLAPPTEIHQPSQPSYSFYGINFNDASQRIRIKIYPPDRKVNSGNPIVISFIPGQRCVFGDHHACISSFLDESLGETTFITVHSGLGGEGEAFRSAVEGTGFDTAALSLRQVLKNLDQLQGAEVTISQGKRLVRGLKLSIASRIPASSMQAYLKAPVQQALPIAASLNPEMIPFINPGTAQLVLETCGWKMRGEPWAKGITYTSGSIYVSVIQLAP